MDRFEAWLSTMEPRRLAWIAVAVAGTAAAATIAAAPTLPTFPRFPYFPAVPLDWLLYFAGTWYGFVWRPDRLARGLPFLPTKVRGATSVLLAGGVEMGFDLGVQLFHGVGSLPTGTFPVWLLPIHALAVFVTALAWLALTRQHDAKLHGSAAPIRHDVRRAAEVLLLGMLLAFLGAVASTVSEPT